MIRRLLILLLVLVPLSGMMEARAETTPTMNVSVDRGVPLTLSAPAASVFIANPDVADIQVMSPTSVMVFGKKTGQTTLLATDSGGHAILYRTIIVAQDLSDLRHELNTAIPDNKIEVQSLPDGIVLTGEAHDPVAVIDAQKIAQRFVSKDGQIINRIHVVGSNQIMIRVRFAEVSRNVDKSFGIDWGALTSAGGFVFGLASGASVSALTGISSLGTLSGERPNNATLAQSNDVIGFSHQGSRVNVNGLIDALAQDGLVSILAEPNLTAMSGETANFLAGGEFPIPIPQANGTISIEFKPYGISLSFTPTLVGADRINLHVKPEVSQLTTVGAITINQISVPALTTRKAETTVELGSGQSFAIAGLLDNNQNQTVNKYPFLGDIPILGSLFRSTKFINDQSELVIIITPYVVKAGGITQAMALPTDGFSPPSEAERLLGLRNSSGDPNQRPMSGDPIAVPVAPVTPAPYPQPHADMSSPDVTPLAAAAPTTNNLVLNHNSNMNTTSEQNITPRAAPVMPVAASPGPSGPGGFLLE